MALNEDAIAAIVHAVTAALSNARISGGRIDAKALGGPPEWDANKDESGFLAHQDQGLAHQSGRMSTTLAERSKRLR